MRLATDPRRLLDEATADLTRETLTMSPPDDRDRGRLTGWFVGLAYVGLFAAGIPWYWPRGSTTLWFGMPAWLLVAIAASAGVSLLTALALRHRWPGEDVPPEGTSQGKEDGP
jgi:hypothetical protein